MFSPDHENSRFIWPVGVVDQLAAPIPPDPQEALEYFEQQGVVDSTVYGKTVPRLTVEHFLEQVFMNCAVQGVVTPPSCRAQRVVNILDSFQVRNFEDRQFFYFPDDTERRFDLIEYAVRAVGLDDREFEDLFKEELIEDTENFERIAKLTEVDKCIANEELLMGFSIRVRERLDWGRRARPPHQHMILRANSCKYWKGPGSVLILGDYPAREKPWKEQSVESGGATFSFKGGQGWPSISPENSSGIKAPGGRIAVMQWAIPARSVKNLNELLKEPIPS